MTSSPRRSPLLAALLIVALPAGLDLLVPAAHAGEVERAEHVRLSEEMKKFAARNAWNAVEASYQKLLILAASGEALTYEDHWLGSLAARDAGNAAEWKKRLLRAQAVKDTEEVRASLSEITSGYGEVRILIDPRARVVPDFQVTILPFAPDQAANVRYVEKVIEALGSYEGPLAAGTYKLPGADPAEFTVQAGSTEPILVRLGDISKAPFKVAAGVRFGVGGQFLAASDPGVGASIGADGQISGGPGGFSLIGGRGGAALEINFAPNLTAYVGASGGYGAGGAAIDGQPLDAMPGNSGLQVLGEAGIGYRVVLGESGGTNDKDPWARPLWIRAGVPVGLVSSTVAMEVTPYDALGVVQTEGADNRQYVRGQRGALATGLSLELAVGLAPVGGSLDLGLGLGGGLLYAPGDSASGAPGQAMPYGMLDLTFMPRFAVGSKAAKAAGG